MRSQRRRRQRREKKLTGSFRKRQKNTRPHSPSSRRWPKRLTVGAMLSLIGRGSRTAKKLTYYSPRQQRNTKARWPSSRTWLKLSSTGVVRCWTKGEPKRETRLTDFLRKLQR